MVPDRRTRLIRNQMTPSLVRPQLHFMLSPFSHAVPLRRVCSSKIVPELVISFVSVAALLIFCLSLMLFFHVSAAACLKLLSYPAVHAIAAWQLS